MKKELLPDILTDSIGFNFGRFGAIGRKLLLEKLLPLGVDDTQLGVLTVLENKGPLVQARLSDYLEIDKATMVSIINELISKGLVFKTPHPSDKRAHHVYITNRGKEILRKAWQVSREVTEELFSVLTDEERKMLMNMLKRLYEHAYQLQERSGEKK